MHTWLQGWRTGGTGDTGRGDQLIIRIHRILRASISSFPIMERRLRCPEGSPCSMIGRVWYPVMAAGSPRAKLMIIPDVYLLLLPFCSFYGVWIHKPGGFRVAAVKS